jgi:hypothetical protein
VITNVASSGFYVVEFMVKTQAWTSNCKHSPKVVLQPAATDAPSVILEPDTTPPPVDNPYPDGICSLSAQKVVQLPAGPLNVAASGTLSWTLTIRPYE